MRGSIKWLAVLLCLVLVGLVPAAAAEVSSVPPEAASSLSSEASSSEVEFIHNEPGMKLPAHPPGLAPVGVIGWALILAAILGVVLFVFTARAQDRRAFRSRSAARSRWQRRGPVQSGMSEKIHHDNSHMRR